VHYALVVQETTQSPKERKRETEYLTAEKVRALLDCPFQTNIRDRLILRLLASTGARVTELINLTWRDVSTFPNQEYVRYYGKRGKIREVPIDDLKLVNLLQKYRGDLEPNIDEPLFDLTRQGITAMVKRYAQRAGIQETAYSHILRHSYAVGRLKAGMDLRTLQRLLGHARIDTTEKYLKITNIDIRDRVKEARLEW